MHLYEASNGTSTGDCINFTGSNINRGLLTFFMPSDLLNSTTYHSPNYARLKPLNHNLYKLEYQYHRCKSQTTIYLFNNADSISPKPLPETLEILFGFTVQSPEVQQVTAAPPQWQVRPQWTSNVIGSEDKVLAPHWIRGLGSYWEAPWLDYTGGPAYREICVPWVNDRI